MMEDLLKGKRVVIVDEDEIQMSDWVTELRARGAEILFVRDADQCLALLAERPHVDLFSLDVMLPSTTFSEEETYRFMLTGVVLAGRVRAAYPDTPIVLLSNHSGRDFIERIRGTLDRIGNAAYLRKMDFESPYQFGEAYTKAVESGVKALANPSLRKKLAKVFILQPNIGGIGFDLKEFLEWWKDMRRRW